MAEEMIDERGSLNSGPLLAGLSAGLILGLSSCAMEMNQNSFVDLTDRPSPQSERVYQGEYVLVYSDSRFFEVVDDKDRYHRGYSWSHSEARAAFAPAIVVEVVADHGDMIEVRRTSLFDEPVCDNLGILRNSAVDLRYFVAREDLALTVKEPISYRYEDGTGYDVLPGLTLMPDGGEPGRYRTWHDEFSFTIDLPEEHVGVGFVEVEPFEKQEWGNRLIPVDADTRVGEHLVKNKVEEGDIFAGYELEVRGDRTLLRVERECATLVVLVPSEDASHGGMGSASGFGFSCGGVISGSYLIFDAGTTAYWPNGEEAGELSNRVHHYPTAGEDSEVVCLTTVLMDYVDEDVTASDEERTVEYCLRTEDGRASGY